MTLRHRTTALLLPLLLLALSVLAACSSGGGGGVSLVIVENFTAAPEDRAVVLSWTLQQQASGYRLSYALTPGFDPATGTQVDLVLPPFLHDGLTNGVELFYRIAATSGGQLGPYSDELSATPQFSEDPFLKDQWHLENTGQGGGMPGEDAHVAPAWMAGIEGTGVVVAVVDDGLEIGHEDLFSNVLPGASFDYVDGDSDPTRGEHGTSCAGIASARGGNGLGVSGAAPRSGLVGFDFLADSTVSNQADAMVRGLDFVDVSSNSWGPPDGTGDLGYPPQTWRDAIQLGINQGRGGLGIVYVFAGGNGHLGPPGGAFGHFDDANQNGFATHPGVIAVGAVDGNGKRAVYSERGANLLLCAPSARSGLPPSPVNPKISTTDRSGAEGYNDGSNAIEYADPDYTRGFDGTSASTPLVAGVVALVLQANPALTYRDVRELLASTARRNDPAHADWVQNADGRWVNHDYGFGVIDAAAAVEAASGWAPVGPLTTHVGPEVEPDLAIPDADPNGVTLLLPVNGSGISHIEHIELVFTSDHPFPPDLEIELSSPNVVAGGTSSSRLAVAHDTTEEMPLAFDQWRFATVRHLGEQADGVWRLRVADLLELDTGSVQRVQLVIRGR